MANENLLKSPVKFGFIITCIGTILLFIPVTLQSVCSINLPSIFFSLIYLVSIILLGWSYRQKYNENLSKNLILKTALYSSIFIIPLFLTLSILLIIYNHTPVAIFFILLGLVVFFVNFGVVYFNLNFSNVIFINNILRRMLNNIKLPKKLAFSLQPDEIIVLSPKRTTIKAFLITLIIYILLIVYWICMGNKIDAKFGTISIITNRIILPLAILDTIDMLLFSKFILTNKRIIKKRYFIYTEASLNDIELITSKQTLDFGTITIISKNGYALHSPIIANPNNVKSKIENFIKTLPTD